MSIISNLLIHNNPLHRPNAADALHQLRQLEQQYQTQLECRRKPKNQESIKTRINYCDSRCNEIVKFLCYVVKLQNTSF